MIRIDSNETAVSDNLHINWSNEDTDDISLVDNYMVPIYEAVLAKHQVRSILDIGCGNGHFSSHLKNERTQLTGVDGNKYGLKCAYQKGFDHCYYVQDFDRDPILFKEEKFDLVICKDVLEHLLKPDKVLKEIKESMNHQGRAFILVPNHFSLYHRLKFLFSAKLDVVDFFPKAKEWNYPHIRFYSHEGMTSFLNEFGLVIEADYSDNFFYFLPRGNALFKLFGLDKLLANSFPNLFSTAFAFVVKAKA